MTESDAENLSPVGPPAWLDRRVLEAARRPNGRGGSGRLFAAAVLTIFASGLLVRDLGVRSRAREWRPLAAGDQARRVWEVLRKGADQWPGGIR